MNRSNPDARQVIAAMADRRARAHATARWWTCPWPAVERHVPRTGDVVELGCGHGLGTLYMALRSPGRRLHGVDIDDDKLAIARTAARNLGLADRVSFDRPDDDESPLDAVVICDVLYLLGAATAIDTVRRLAGRVRRGGRVVCKEMRTESGWRRRIADGQEFLATKVVGYTKGDHNELVDLQALGRSLAPMGFTFTVEDCSSGYVHPHSTLIAVRNGVAETDV